MMEFTLPIIFAGLMALAMLMYVVLDGYDLGVGILLPFADEIEKDRMVASIGPFWDANETWLVLGVGLLLVAFPAAHGVIMTSLYLPICFMLCGLILRGVAFDFRYKVHAAHKSLWDRLFFAGSLIAALAQGYMLGRYITGFGSGSAAVGFALLASLCMAAGYGLLGASWLVLKAEGKLQANARRWAGRCLLITGFGVVAISIVTPLVSARIFERWFSWPAVVFLAPIPVFTFTAFVACWRALGKTKTDYAWRPFACSVAIFVLSFIGLTYSLFPYLVIDRLDIWQAASATASLQFMLYGAVIAVPAILGYTVYSYFVFWGKTTDLSYD